MAEKNSDLNINVKVNSDESQKKLSELNQSFIDLTKLSASLATSINFLTTEHKGLTEQFKSSVIEIKNRNANLIVNIEKTQNLADKFGTLANIGSKTTGVMGLFDQKMRTVSQILGVVADGSKKFSNGLEIVENKLEKAQKILVPLSKILGENKQKLDENGKAAEFTAKDFEHYTQGIENLTKGTANLISTTAELSWDKVIQPLSTLYDKTMDTAKAMGTFALAGTAVSAVIENHLVKSYTDLNSEMANVNSVLLASPKQFAELNDQVRDLSVSFKLATETEIAKGLYDVASAGFTGADGIKVMDTSIKASKAGRAELRESSMLIAQTLNSMEMSASNSEGAANILFKTVQRGVLEFKDLAAGAGSVTSILHSLNQPLEVMGASLSIITKKGTLPSEAFTNLNAILTSFAAQSEQSKLKSAELGIKMDATAVKTRGFGAVLKDVIEAAKKTGDFEGTLFTLLGRKEALDAALKLSNADEFEAEMKAMKDSSTAMSDSLTEQTKAVEESFNKIRVGFKSIQGDAGKAFIGIGKDIFPIIEGLIDYFNSLSEETRGTILKWLEYAKIAPLVVAALGAVALGTLALIAHMVALRFAIVLLMRTFAPLATGIGGFVIALRAATKATWDLVAAQLGLKASLGQAMIAVGGTVAFFTAAAVAAGYLIKATMDLDIAQTEAAKNQERNIKAQEDAAKRLSQLREKERKGEKLTSTEQKDYAHSLVNIRDVKTENPGNQKYDPYANKKNFAGQEQEDIVSKFLASNQPGNTNIKEAQKRAKLAKQLEEEEKKSAKKITGYTDDEKKKREEIFQSIQDKKYDAVKSGFEKESREADKWRKDEQKKLQQAVILNTITKEEAAQQNKEIDITYQGLISKARQKQSDDEKKKRQENERNTREDIQKTKAAANEIYQSEINLTEAKINLTENFRKLDKISEQDRIKTLTTLYQKEIKTYTDMSNDKKFSPTERTAAAVKATEMQLKLDSIKVESLKKSSEKIIKEEDKKTEAIDRNLNLIAIKDRLTQDKILNNQIFADKQRIIGIDNILAKEKLSGEAKTKLLEEKSKINNSIVENEARRKIGNIEKDLKDFSDSLDEKQKLISEYNQENQKLEYEAMISSIKYYLAHNKNLTNEEKKQLQDKLKDYIKIEKEITDSLSLTLPKKKFEEFSNQLNNLSSVFSNINSEFSNLKDISNENIRAVGNFFSQSSDAAQKTFQAYNKFSELQFNSQSIRTKYKNVDIRDPEAQDKFKEIKKEEDANNIQGALVAFQGISQLAGAAAKNISLWDDYIKKSDKSLGGFLITQRETLNNIPLIGGGLASLYDMFNAGIGNDKIIQAEKDKDQITTLRNELKTDEIDRINSVYDFEKKKIQDSIVSQELKNLQIEKLEQEHQQNLFNYTQQIQKESIKGIGDIRAANTLNFISEQTNILTTIKDDKLRNLALINSANEFYDKQKDYEIGLRQLKQKNSELYQDDATKLFQQATIQLDELETKEKDKDKRDLERINIKQNLLENMKKLQESYYSDIGSIMNKYYDKELQFIKQNHKADYNLIQDRETKIKANQDKIDILTRQLEKINEEFDKRLGDKALSSEAKKQFESQKNTFLSANSGLDAQKLIETSPTEFLRIVAARKEEIDAQFTADNDLNKKSENLKALAIQENIYWDQISKNLVKGTKEYDSAIKSANDGFRDYKDAVKMSIESQKQNAIETANITDKIKTLTSENSDMQYEINQANQNINSDIDRLTLKFKDSTGAWITDINSARMALQGLSTDAQRAVLELNKVQSAKTNADNYVNNSPASDSVSSLTQNIVSAYSNPVSDNFSSFARSDLNLPSPSSFFGGAAEGGIYSGPKSGFLGLLHGPEELVINQKQGNNLAYILQMANKTPSQNSSYGGDTYQIYINGSGLNEKQLVSAMDSYMNQKRIQKSMSYQGNN